MLLYKRLKIFMYNFKIMKLFIYLKIYVDWGLGIWDCGLAQSPIPNPQSPIPNKNR